MGGFDEEAERERLREKYEQDREKREATQRMSELLLKGATMTNRHCEECGDPIFSHDGQEFCPTCAGDEDGAAAPADDGETDAGEAGAEDEAAKAADGEAEAPSQSTGRDDSEARTTDPTDHVTGQRRPPATRRDSSARGEGRPSRAESDGRASPLADRGPVPTSDAGGSPVDEARASLERTLLTYARAAEEADDPRRAKDALAAAREAAETLAALQ